MPRYTLRPGKEEEWRVVFRALVHSGTEIATSTLNRIGNREPVNGKTIEKQLQHEVDQLFDGKYPNILKTFFDEQAKKKKQQVDKLSLASNHARSDDMLRWINKKVETGEYDSIDLFCYTNETLHSFVKTLNLNVRCLARNWVVEKAMEDAFNERYRKGKGIAFWQKSASARWSAELIADPGNSNCISLEQRYYRMPPFFKGVIIWNSLDSQKKAGYIGFYFWDKEREGGGSPYAGVRWSALRLTCDGGEQEFLLQTLHSRFEEIWEDSDTYESVSQEDKRNEQQDFARKIWSVGDRAYKIIIPGVVLGHDRNPFSPPDVNYYDAISAERIREFLEKHEAMATVEIMKLENFPRNASKPEIKQHLEKLEETRLQWLADHIGNFDGHVVFMCSRTLTNPIRTYLKKAGFPFEFYFDKPNADKIYARNRGTYYASPLDDKDQQQTGARADYCILGKADRPGFSNGSKIFMVGGIHAIGTLGGSSFFTDETQISRIHDLIKGPDIERTNFGMVIRSIQQRADDTDIETSVFEDPTWLD